MQEIFDRLTRMVYKSWKRMLPKAEDTHPDEEALVCFVEGKLSPEENERIKAHLISCSNCMEAFTLNFELKPDLMQEVPEALMSRVKDLLMPQGASALLEIVLRLKERFLELLNTSGDVLVDQELVPAPVLRSRSIKDFKDEVTILKDFKDIRVEVKIENKGGKIFNLMIMVKQKETQKIIKDLRVTLVKDDLELESYQTDSGSATFEHVLLGKYRVEISTIDEKLASILLDIKI